MRYFIIKNPIFLGVDLGSVLWSYNTKSKEVYFRDLLENDENKAIMHKNLFTERFIEITKDQLAIAILVGNFNHVRQIHN